MAWIKLQIHPEHHKVLVLSDLTGERPETVFASAVRWFFFLDEHYSGGPLAVTEGSLHRITHWNGRKSLAAAMAHQEIGWLESTSDDRLRPTDPEAHFSSSAKKRALTAKRVSANRERNAGVTQPALQERYLEKELEREKDKDRVSECAGEREAAADPIGLIVHLAKRDLSTSEQALVWRDYDAAVATDAGALWLASARQMAQEPGYTFGAVGGALTYLNAILNRCRGDGTKPGERVVRLAATGPPETDSPEEIRAIVAEALQRGKKPK